MKVKTEINLFGIIIGIMMLIAGAFSKEPNITVAGIWGGLGLLLIGLSLKIRITDSDKH